MIRVRTGFTLLELVLVTGIIVILAGIVWLALDPMEQLAAARNAVRRTHVDAIATAMGSQYAKGKSFSLVDSKWRMLGTSAAGDCASRCGNLRNGSTRFALSLPGTTQPEATYLSTVGAFPSITLNQPLSVSLWFLWRGGWSPIMLKQSSGPSEAFMLYSYDGNNFFLLMADGLGYVVYQFPFPLEQEVYHHVIFTFDGGNSYAIRLFVDGQEVTPLYSQINLSSGSPVDPGQYVGDKLYVGYFGLPFTSNGQVLQGTIDGFVDDLRFYRSVLSPADAALLGDGEEPTESASNLFAHWSFDYFDVTTLLPTLPTAPSAFPGTPGMELQYFYRNVAAPITWTDDIPPPLMKLPPGCIDLGPDLVDRLHRLPEMPVSPRGNQLTYKNTKIFPVEPDEERSFYAVRMATGSLLVRSCAVEDEDENGDGVLVTPLIETNR